MKLLAPVDYLSGSQVCAALGVSRATFLRMLAQGRFPRPCRTKGTKHQWSHSVVADKLTTQLALWLGKGLLTTRDYKPLMLKRPLGMKRRDAEKLLEKIEAQVRKRDKPYYMEIEDANARWSEEAKFNRANWISRAYAHECSEARAAGTPLSQRQKVDLYRRLSNSKPDELRRFVSVLRLSEKDTRRPVTGDWGTYSEPEEVLPR